MENCDWISYYTIVCFETFGYRVDCNQVLLLLLLCPWQRKGPTRGRGHIIATRYKPEANSRQQFYILDKTKWHLVVLSFVRKHCFRTNDRTTITYVLNFDIGEGFQCRTMNRRMLMPLNFLSSLNYSWNRGSWRHFNAIKNEECLPVWRPGRFQKDANFTWQQMDCFHFY